MSSREIWAFVAMLCWGALWDASERHRGTVLHFVVGVVPMLALLVYIYS